MFDLIRKHIRPLQIILILLVFPSFVFFGIEGYGNFKRGDSNAVATVDGHGISRDEWEAAQREQIERVRRQMPNVDAKLFDSPEMKRESLEAVVRERVMLTAANQLNLATSDARLQRVFATDPQLAFLRNPDGSVNKDVLAAQGMSSEMFAQRLRHDLSLRQVMLGLSATVIAPKTATAEALDAMFQQREVQVQRFDTQEFLAQVKPTEAEIEAYYKDPAHAQRFLAPESESIEYVVLSLDAVKKGIKVSDEDLRAYYTQNEARFTAPEERRASHILIKVEKGAPAAEIAAAKAKAQALLEQARKDPADFAELARKNSQDPGSAEKGGDLGYFGRGAMVKPFEDAAFALKKGQISDLVQSDFGFHIIKLTDVRGGEKRSFDSVRAQIEDEVKTQLAHKRFTELAGDFTNVVYEQPDSLTPAAQKFNLEIQTATDVTRTPAPGATGALADPKFLEALFGTDAVRNKRNTEAISIAPSTLVSGRVVKHTPAHRLPLVEVKARVGERLSTLQAAALARKAGEARLAALRVKPDTAMAEPEQVVSRAQTHGLPREVLDAVLEAPTSALPTLVGVDLGDAGYAVAKVTKVLGRDPTVGDPASAQAQYAQAWNAAEMQAYYDALKKRFDVEIKPAAIGPADSAASVAK